MKTELTNMKSELQVVKKKNKSLEDRFIDVQSRSMRDNFIFYNIKEENMFGIVDSVEFILSEFIMS